MSESEVMARLRKIVTKHDPNETYSKQKKIGQGASGSVYIAKVRSDATSPVGKSLYRRDGSEARVAIKTMDLKHQPRKELIVNEIIVMKESVHPNIVNYLDSFLIENDSELWVIMEYMNGGALTDVIENNPVISEDQIAAICNEVSMELRSPPTPLTPSPRHARAWRTCTRRRLSTVTSRATTCC
jgi:serine/threonine protein kinase